MPSNTNRPVCRPVSMSIDNSSNAVAAASIVTARFAKVNGCQPAGSENAVGAALVTALPYRSVLTVAISPTLHPNDAFVRNAPATFHASDVPTDGTCSSTVLDFSRSVSPGVIV